MTHPSMMTADTIFHKLHNTDNDNNNINNMSIPIRIITVKGKLLKMLSHELPAYNHNSNTSNVSIHQCMRH